LSNSQGQGRALRRSRGPVGPLLGSLLLVAVVYLVAAASAWAAPPANDDFADAAPLTLGSTVAGTNEGATKEVGEPDHAGNAGGHSVWYSWTPGQTEMVGLSLPCNFFGGGLEALLGVYTGSAIDSLTQVASNQGLSTGACNPFNEDPEVEFEAHAGVEYRVAVDGKDGDEGTFSLTLSGPPANDEFAAAQTIPAEPPSSIHGTTRLASKQAGEPDHAGDPGGHSVWFNWTPQTSGPVIISTCEAASDLDSVLAVYTGSEVGALTPVASNDNAIAPGLFPECLSTDSEVRLEAVANTTYRIAVDGAGGTVGGFNLRIQGRPANDSFSSPQVLSPSRQTNASGGTTNKLATKEPGEPDHAGDPGGRSVWFSWTPNESGEVSLHICPRFNEPLETVAAVYTGAPVNALNQVASSADATEPICGPSGSEASWVAQAGTTYMIAVDGKEDSEGIFQLSLEKPSPNDEFAHATTLPGAFPLSVSASTKHATSEAGEPPIAPDADGHSVWYSWTPTASGPVAITACPYNELGGDPVLAVYTGSALDALTPVAADDGSGAACSSGASEVEIDAIAGTEYKIAVDARNGDGGIFSLELSGVPGNDDFADAWSVPAEPVLPLGGTTRFATKQPGEPDHADDAGGHSVWFSWTPSKSGPVAVLACPGGFGGYAAENRIEALLGVYTGNSVESLTEVASNRGGPVTPSVECQEDEEGGATEVDFDATAGTEYKIAVDGAAGGEGKFGLAFERGPANDEFGAAQILQGSLPLSAAPDDRFATVEPGEPQIAGVPGGHSVWYSWTPTTSGPVWISTCTTSGALDTLLGVYTGEAVDGLTEVASDDDGPTRATGCRATDSGVEVNAVAGTTYRIAVDGKGGSVGPTQLEIEAPPANDDFARAQSLGTVLPSQWWGSNRFASVEPDEPDIGGVPGGHSVWFTWAAPRTGEVEIDTCGSAIDTLLGVYTGSSLTSLSPVASNDDADGECSPGSRVQFAATAGTQYKIAVDGARGAIGAIRLQLAGPPANDDFANATGLGHDSIYSSGSNALATPEGGEPSPGGHSVWYSWTPGVSGPAMLEACGHGFLPRLGIYTGGALASLTAVPTTAAAPGGRCAEPNRVDFDVVAGTTYRIAVGGSDSGSFELHLVSAVSRLRQLTVRTEGDGSGSVSSSPAGIDCGTICHYSFALGTLLTLHAEPAPDSHFAGWSGFAGSSSGGCSDTGSCVVTVESAAAVTATFAPGPGPTEDPGAGSGEGPGDGSGETPGTGTGTGETPGGDTGDGSSQSSGDGSSNSTGTPSTTPAETPTIWPGAEPKPQPKPVCRVGTKKVRVHGKLRCVKKAPPKHPKHRKHAKHHG
jgi:hypothetical protein